MFSFVRLAIAYASFFAMLKTHHLQCDVRSVRTVVLRDWHDTEVKPVSSTCAARHMDMHLRIAGILW